MSGLILERIQIAAGILPVDLQGGANNGDWVSLENYDRCAIVLYKDGGTASDDPTITVVQATDTAGSGPKPLNFTRLWRKQASNIMVNGDAGKWEEVTQAAGNTYTNTTLAEEECLIVIEFRAEDLDVENGYKALRATIADVGSNAQLGCTFYILADPVYPAGPTDMKSALV